MDKKAIIDAYVTMRITNSSIPDDVLDFMKQSALDALEPKRAGFSMDGLRLQMANEFNALHEEIDCIKDEIEINTKYLKDRMDTLAGLIGILCCTYNDDYDDYNLINDDVELLRFDKD